MFGPDISSKNIGCRNTFADVGQTLAMHLRIPPLAHGETFLPLK